MMHSVDLELLRQLRASIKERQDELVSGLTSGAGINDFADYRHRVGQFKALGDIEAWGQQINDKLMGKDKGKAA